MSKEEKSAANLTESMTDAEKEMMTALGEEETSPVAPSSPIHPVEMDAVKPIPKGTPDHDANLRLILDIPVDIKVEVGNSRLTINEVLNLAPGSIVELDRTAGSPADLIVNGTKVGHGDIVVIDDSYGIRLTKLIDPQDRIDSL